MRKNSKSEAYNFKKSYALLSILGVIVLFIIGIAITYYSSAPKENANCYNKSIEIVSKNPTKTITNDDQTCNSILCSNPTILKGLYLF
jgi:uncharacterized membrane protein